MSPKPCSRPWDLSQVQKARGKSMRHEVLGAEPEAGMDSGITVHPEDSRAEEVSIKG